MGGALFVEIEYAVIDSILSLNCFPSAAVTRCSIFNCTTRKVTGLGSQQQTDGMLGRGGGRVYCRGYCQSVGRGEDSQEEKWRHPKKP